MGPNIRVGQFLSDGYWNLPPPTSGDLITTWNQITTEIKLELLFEDEVVWTLEENGCYSLKFAYSIISNFQDYVQLDWVEII